MTDENGPDRQAPKFAFLHVGKTGGSAIKLAIDQSVELTGQRMVRVLGHHRKLAEFADRYSDAAICFVVRDPVNRYVSAFNSRFRRGQGGKREWRPAEVRLFTRFPTANALAEALSSADEATRTRARNGIGALHHLRRNLTFHFESVELLEQMKERIVFIGHLPTLADDFEMFRTITGLSPEASLPSDDIEAHKAPDGQCKKLSARGEESIRRHFETDYPIYEWCLQKRAELVAAFETANGP